MGAYLESGKVLRSVPQSFTYSAWRHGGWYVNEVRYPSGATGCVSRNYTDKRWRIVCDPRSDGHSYTYPSRDAAARAEWGIAQSLHRGDAWFPPDVRTLRYLTDRPELPQTFCGACYQWHVPAKPCACEVAP